MPLRSLRLSAAVALTGVATGASACAAPRGVRSQAHLAGRAGCEVPRSPPVALATEPDTDVCSIVPDAAPCRYDDLSDQAASHLLVPPATDAPEPMHLQPSCAAIYRPTEAHELRRDLWAQLQLSMGYPDGPDVVIAGVAADGVDLESARSAAHDMLWPLSRCYIRHVDEAAKTAPQGHLFIAAGIEPDGAVDGVQIDASAGLPQDLAVCARRYLRARRLGRPFEDLASIEIDVRFVYRRLMEDPHETVAEGR